jgi:hypothetical protein
MELRFVVGSYHSDASCFWWIVGMECCSDNIVLFDVVVLLDVVSNNPHDSGINSFLDPSQ